MESRDTHAPSPASCPAAKTHGSSQNQNTTHSTSVALKRNARFMLNIAASFRQLSAANHNRPVIATKH